MYIYVYIHVYLYIYVYIYIIKIYNIYSSENDVSTKLLIPEAGVPLHGR